MEHRFTSQVRHLHAQLAPQVPIQDFARYIRPEAIGLSSASQFHAPIRFSVQICGGLNAAAGAMRVDVPVHANPDWFRDMKCRFAKMLGYETTERELRRMDFCTVSSKSISTMDGDATRLERAGKLNFCVDGKIVRAVEMPECPMEYSVSKVPAISEYVQNALDSYVLHERVADALVNKSVDQINEAIRLDGPVQRIIEDHLASSLPDAYAGDWNEFVRAHHMNSPYELPQAESEKTLHALGKSALTHFRDMVAAAAEPIEQHLSMVKSCRIAAELKAKGDDAVHHMPILGVDASASTTTTAPAIASGHELFTKLAKDALESPMVRQSLTNMLYNRPIECGHCRWDEDRKTPSSRRESPQLVVIHNKQKTVVQRQEDLDNETLAQAERYARDVADLSRQATAARTAAEKARIAKATADLAAAKARDDANHKAEQQRLETERLRLADAERKAQEASAEAARKAPEPVVEEEEQTPKARTTLVTAPGGDTLITGTSPLFSNNPDWSAKPGQAELAALFDSMIKQSATTLGISRVAYTHDFTALRHIVVDHVFTKADGGNCLANAIGGDTRGGAYFRALLSTTYNADQEATTAELGHRAELLGHVSFEVLGRVEVAYKITFNVLRDLLQRTNDFNGLKQAVDLIRSGGNVPQMTEAEKKKAQTDAMAASRKKAEAEATEKQRQQDELAETIRKEEEEQRKNRATKSAEEVERETAARLAELKRAREQEAAEAQENERKEAEASAKRLEEVNRREQERIRKQNAEKQSQAEKKRQTKKDAKVVDIPLDKRDTTVDAKATKEFAGLYRTVKQRVFWKDAKLSDDAKANIKNYIEKMSTSELEDYLSLLRALSDKDTGADEVESLKKYNEWLILERLDKKTTELTERVLKALYLDGGGDVDMNFLANEHDRRAIADRLNTVYRALHGAKQVQLKSRIEAHHPWNALVHHTLKSEAGHYPAYYNSLHTKQDMTKDAHYPGDVQATYDAYSLFMGRPAVPRDSIVKTMEDRLVPAAKIPPRPPLAQVGCHHDGSRHHRRHSSDIDEEVDSEIDFMPTRRAIGLPLPELVPYKPLEDEFSALGLPTMAQAMAAAAKQKQKK